MQSDWSSYRITLLLYLGVLLIPLSFYYTYSTIEDVASDTATIQQLNAAGGGMLALGHIKSEADSIKTKSNIDQNLKVLAPWFNSKDREELYAGGKSMSGRYEQLLSCWSGLQGNPQDAQAQACWKKAKSLSFTVNTMLLLKQKKLKNIFYVNLLLAVIFLLLMILLVRNYIHKELLKNSIYDLPTKLYTKDYFLTHLDSSHARAKRHNYPLSMLAIELDDIDNNRSYDSKTKEHIHSILGGLVASLTRSSDIACRYDHDRFVIIMPDTPTEGTLILKGRIREALDDKHFTAYPDLHFKVGSAQFDGHETPEAFVTRAFDDLA